MMSTAYGDCSSQWHTTAMQRYLYYAAPRYARCAYLRDLRTFSKYIQ